jgi:hypothetical protein
MRAVLCRLVIGAVMLVAACSKREPANDKRDTGDKRGSAVAPAKGGADPLGPCTWFVDDECREHEALFAEAVAKATAIRLEATPIDSGRLSRAATYFAQVTAPAGKRLRITVGQLGDAPGAGTRFRLRRWASRVDGWQVSEDAFNTSGPGGAMVQDIVPDPGVPQLIAVLADPPADFQIRFSAE